MMRKLRGEHRAVSGTWPVRALGGALHLAAVLGLVLPAAGQVTIKEGIPTVPFKVKLTLKGPATLALSDIKYADIPSGKRVGLSYSGVKNPQNIAYFTGLGFRTSVSVGTNATTEELKVLEDAGADLTMEGGVGPEMGLTPQETLDGAAMRRVNLTPRVRSPVAVGPYNNMRNNFDLPTRRNVGGYLYAIHDSNYLACNSWAAGYAVLAGRNRTPEQFVRPHNSNSAGGAPNTLVYYQTLANILQGMVEMMTPGEVTTIELRDFKLEDRKRVETFIGKWGKDARVWHTTQHEICGYAYLKEKSRISDVKALSDTELEIALAVEHDLYLPFCPAPLSLKLPKDFPLKSARLWTTDCPVSVTEAGVFVDIPVQKAFQTDCVMTLKLPPSMTIPEEVPVTLTIKNTSGAALENARLSWSGNVGMEVTGGTEETFTLAAGAERTVQAKVRSLAGPREGVKPRGARFGLAPINAFVTATVGGQERVSGASWEVVVAPRLRVEVDPRNVPIAKGEAFNFYVHVANGKIDKDRVWGKFSDEKLIDYRTGPCKGTVGFRLPEGMEAVPPSQPFELAENGHALLQFLIRNNQWGDDKPAYVYPAIRFEGEKDPIEIPWYGTGVMRDAAMEIKPLDEKGLLARACWDDKKNTRGNLDASAGSPFTGGETGGHTPSPDGVKGWCVSWQSNLGYDAFKNIDYHKGTILFWNKRDPQVRNDLQLDPDPANSWKVPTTYTNYGEKVIAVGLNRDLILRRFPKRGERDGYLELILRDMPVRGRPTKIHYVQAPYESSKLYDWRHIGILWDIKERRLELYLDGKLAGKADKGDSEWLVYPWDTGRPTRSIFLIEIHHDNWAGSMRDEMYIYNRPLTVEGIKENMDLAKQVKASN